MQRTTLSTTDVINMEGYVEQLPIGKKKTTLLKTWKRIYCKAREGSMYISRVCFCCLSNAIIRVNENMTCCLYWSCAPLAGHAVVKIDKKIQAS